MPTSWAADGSYPKRNRSQLEMAGWWLLGDNATDVTRGAEGKSAHERLP